MGAAEKENLRAGSKGRIQNKRIALFQRTPKQDVYNGASMVDSTVNWSQQWSCRMDKPGVLLFSTAGLGEMKQWEHFGGLFWGKIGFFCKRKIFTEIVGFPQKLFLFHQKTWKLFAKNKTIFPFQQIYFDLFWAAFCQDFSVFSSFFCQTFFIPILRG